MVAADLTAYRISGGRTIAKTRVVDDSGSLDLVFFNMEHRRDALHQGDVCVFFGKVEDNLRRKQMIMQLIRNRAGNGQSSNDRKLGSKGADGDHRKRLILQLNPSEIALVVGSRVLRIELEALPQCGPAGEIVEKRLIVYDKAVPPPEGDPDR